MGRRWLYEKARLLRRQGVQLKLMPRGRKMTPLDLDRLNRIAVAALEFSRQDDQ